MNLIYFKKYSETSLRQKKSPKNLTSHCPNGLSIQSATNHRYSELLEIEVDKGEASAISLALEIDNSLLILDDQKARKLAERLRLNYTGTLGILLKAKELGILSAIKPALQKIQQTNFRFSEKVLNDILRAADE